ncbi:MAG: hypothetical protein A2788_01290 [Candidatus Abawacabacteria bacterium RIFCSPHIGHO2_01_FULL_46_8]|uniref:Acylphosphatase n=1 Tax=Candidatus Abawacabacteria bacterium RIFCSPHIGHO2_01_FULL_46_8 TaxID=1817815 RepID=A0A1F4XL87_9BACT|nr:MAG: hypothetical protein A2788_01290 [Candidatus Abawacabacteria bacterium RIFCSPHIGHO2_01_FULL_46_8]
MKRLKLKLKIFGRVQGVFFRDHAQAKAAALALVGFVRNELDGTVYIEVEGEEEKLAQFLTWCQQGPEAAVVEKVEHQFSDQLENFSSFEIRYN